MTLQRSLTRECLQKNSKLKKLPGGRNMPQLAKAADELIKFLSSASENLIHFFGLENAGPVIAQVLFYGTIVFIAFLLGTAIYIIWRQGLWPVIMKILGWIFGFIWDQIIMRIIGTIFKLGQILVIVAMWPFNLLYELVVGFVNLLGELVKVLLFLGGIGVFIFCCCWLPYLAFTTLR